jgi:hypothetical protein
VKELKVVIDRIENQIAVVLFGDEEIKVDLPLSLLPDGVKEGSHLNVTFELNPESEASKRERVAGLLERLSRKGEQAPKL